LIAEQQTSQHQTAKLSGAVATCDSLITQLEACHNRLDTMIEKLVSLHPHNVCLDS